jgi:hypothetical protein
MVEPLFSTTSTRAEVWLVLRELCLPHPRVDVYAHFCWKCMFTYMVWPLQFAEWMKGLWPVPLSALCSVAVDVNPDGWTTVFHHIFKSWGVVGFYVSWVLHILAWMCMLTCVGSGWKPICVDHFDVQSWVKGLWPVPLSAICLVAVE